MRKLLLIVLVLSSIVLKAQDSLLRITQAQLPLITYSVAYINALNKIAYLIHQKIPTLAFIMHTRQKLLQSKIIIKME